jgi:hypothetical protein
MARRVQQRSGHVQRTREHRRASAWRARILFRQAAYAGGCAGDAGKAYGEQELAGFLLVIPAKAGIQLLAFDLLRLGPLRVQRKTLDSGFRRND